MKTTVLVIDDDPDFCVATERALRRRHEVVTVQSGREGLERLGQRPIDMVLLDLHMPEQDGLSVLAAMRTAGFQQPVLVLSGAGTIESAVKAVQLGALDFLQKPVERERLAVAIDNALRFERLAARHAQLEKEARPIQELVGDSPVMQRLRDLIAKAAPTDGRVLISGENGTGKELVARAIHTASRRSDQPFVAVNCAAIPSTLIESELFGHERGAFTGAVTARRGRFEMADGGTLFLDEVAEMSPAMQAKLLRVLQESKLERVGGSQTITVDVRVIAATNRDLVVMLEDGSFREDLYYRLNVIPIATAPLRGHVEDIPELAALFLTVACARNGRAPMRLDPGAEAVLQEYDFPGNVRELQNLVERLVIMNDTDVLTREHVAALVRPAPATAATTSSWYRPGASFRELVDDASREILRTALAEHGHNMAQTARALGLERSHLYKKCRALGVTTG